MEVGPITRSIAVSLLVRRLTVSAGLAAGLACGAPPPPGGPLALIDDSSDIVHLPGPASRVVSLSPATTEALFAIGAGAVVVGRTTWCDEPAAARDVPSVGDGLSPNIEAVVERAPDLVVLYRSPSNAPAVARLRALGIPVLQLRIDNLADFARGLAVLGEATGRSAEAARLQAGMDSAFAVSQAPAATGPRVLMVTWLQPPMVIGRGSFLHEIVERAGGRNIFADLPSPSAPISLEEIAARDPDVILVTGDAPGVLARPEWQVVPAVRQRRLVRVEGTEFLRPSPRAPAAVRRLRAALDEIPRR